MKRTVAERYFLVTGLLRGLAVQTGQDPDAYLNSLHEDARRRGLSGAAVVEFFEHVERAESTLEVENDTRVDK